MKINQATQRRLNQIAKKHKLRLLVAFGSVATGITHPQSDLDIAVSPVAPDLPHRRYMAIERDLTRVFPNHSIDLVVLAKADPLLLKNISATGILLSGTRKNYQAFKLHAFHRFQDYQPYFELEKIAVQRNLARHVS